MSRKNVNFIVNLSIANLAEWVEYRAIMFYNLDKTIELYNNAESLIKSGFKEGRKYEKKSQKIQNKFTFFAGNFSASDCLNFHFCHSV